MPKQQKNKQQYFIRDLPSKSKGKLKINIANVPNWANNLYLFALHIFTTHHKEKKTSQVKQFALLQSSGNSIALNVFLSTSELHEK